MKIDLHLHSKFSKRPSVWLLNKIGCAESYTEPRELYRLARDRGMDAVTITDHNAISGCLEIAHLPGVVTGVETTTYFPDDGCKLHVLVYGLSEDQFQEIDQLRKNVFDLVLYLNQQGLVHVMAHPFYPVSDRYTIGHFEKGLLLFRYFEQNGDQSPEVNQVLSEILERLDEHLIQKLADKHGLDPIGVEPWRKMMVGGSDDHSSLTMGKVFTKVPGAKNLDEFWAGLRQGQGKPVFTQAASPLTSAHGIYGVAYQFYASKFNLRNEGDNEPVLYFMERMLTSARAVKQRKGDRLRPVARRKSNPGEADIPPMISMFTHEAQKLIERDKGLSSILKGRTPGKKHKADLWFDFVNKSSNQMLAQLSERLASKVVGLNPFDIFHALGAAGAMLTLEAPYYSAFSIHSRSRRLSGEAGEKLAARPLRRMAPRVAVFTDTIDEINGVAKTWLRNTALAALTGKDLTVIGCSDKDQGEKAPRGLHYLSPAKVFSLPEYPEQNIFIPPLLEAIKYCYDLELTHLHAATPGPMGLTAMAAARIIGIPFYTTYHTEIPQYAGSLTGDRRVEDYVWRYIQWFYNQSELIFSPSRATTEELAGRGLSEAKIRLMPRGVDTELFSPEKMRKDLDLPRGTRLLYVGRVSREKNLPFLVRAFKKLTQLHSKLHLIVVGDGPYLEEMKRELAGAPAVFTGYLEGDNLAEIYASCNLFIFPSLTDTFGNVVLEAQASGLPVLVSDVGGPQENLIPGKTGLVLPADDINSLVAAVWDMLRDPYRLREMAGRARQYALTRSFSQAFESYWELYRKPDQPRLTKTVSHEPQSQETSVSRKIVNE